jgi:hypothetical protein
VRFVEAPTQRVPEVLPFCFATIRVSDRKDRLETVVDVVIESERVFIGAVNDGRFRELAGGTFSEEQKEDMTWLYKNKIVGSEIYDKIVSLSGGRCPLCNMTRASTLDHTLPKAKFPWLAVTPLNLVAACKDCNTGKNDKVSEGTLSPYFDAWAVSTNWVEAVIEDPSNPKKLTFRTKRPDEFTGEQYDSVKAFFSEAEMCERYEESATAEYWDFWNGLCDHFIDGGIDELKRELKSRHDGAFAIHANSWRAATYKAWYDSAHLLTWDKFVPTPPPRVDPFFAQVA